MKLKMSMSIFRRVFAGYHFSRAQKLVRQSRFAPAHRSFVAASRFGHTQASYQVGLNYSQGLGCVRSGSEARRWFEVAAEAGHSNAQFELGVLLLSDQNTDWCAGSSARWAVASLQRGAASAEHVFPAGLSFGKDSKRAYNLLQQSAVAGKGEAQANIGWLLLQGIGCEKNLVDARSWLLKADQHNISQAALGLAAVFADKSSEFYDTAERHRWLRRAAELGNVSAAYQLAVLMRYDSPNESNHAEIIKNLLFAAERGHIDASFEYGALLLKRSGGDSDVEKASKFLRIAAKAGHAQAAMQLAELFSRGFEVKRDIREAAFWYRRAADSGLQQAQFEIGCLFARGEGVPQDLKHSAHYFELSAMAGHPAAAFNIGVFYERGDGVEQDISSAIKYLSIAAEKGLPQAQVRLAHLLSSGQNGSVDRVEAVRLLELAIQRGNADAEVSRALMILKDPDGEDPYNVDKLLLSAIAKGHMGAAELVLTRHYNTDEAISIAHAALRLVGEAAKAGSLRAMVLYAQELLAGRYCSVDSAEAERLLRHAAAAGDVHANFQLGVFYCRRNGNPEDLENGLSHYLRAAESGHALAQYNAGVMLLSGTGCISDPPKAMQLLTESAKQGLERAREVLARTGGGHAN